MLNSDLWKQSIKASQYWTLVYASKNVTVYGGAYETITIDGYYGSFTTNADGSVSHVVPIDTITLTGSVSGQSFERTVTSDTTDVYVMPDGLILYWYGYKDQCITNVSAVTTLSQTNGYYQAERGSDGGQATLDFHFSSLPTGYTKICYRYYLNSGYFTLPHDYILTSLNDGSGSTIVKNHFNTQESIAVETIDISSINLSLVKKMKFAGNCKTSSMSGTSIIRVYSIWLE